MALKERIEYMVSGVSSVGNNNSQIDPTVLNRLQQLGVSTTGITSEAQAEAALRAALKKADNNNQSTQNADQDKKAPSGTPPWTDLAERLGVDPKGKPETVLANIANAINALPHDTADQKQKIQGYTQELAQIQSNVNAHQSMQAATASIGMAQVAMQNSK